jgi:Protein of unknown function (DUF3071)
MQELRLVAVSEDGSYAVLVVPGRSGRFALPIDERLRTVAKGQFSRLAQYEIEVESPLRPKEIQDRIRAGETAEDIADAAGLPVERIRRFEGPPLAERARWADEAQRATVRGRGESGPGPRLGDIVPERLADLGANYDDVEWDSRKRQDGNWQVQLAYTVAGRMYVAEWIYDTRSKHVMPDDDAAIMLCLDEEQWPEQRPAARSGGTATVTPIGSRAAPGAGHQHEHREGDRAGGRNIVHPSQRAPAAAPPRQPAAALRVSGDPDTGTGHPRIGAQVSPAAQARAAQGAGVAHSPAVPVSAGDEAPAAAETSRNGSLREPVGARAGRDAAAAAAADEARRAVQAANDAAAAAAEPDDQPAPAAARPARKTASGRSRRSSVPSWDEIMFGNSRQPE